MPIISVTRWNLDPQTAQQLVREAAPLLRQHGATRITLGRIHTGNNSGQTSLAVQYDNWESYGKAQEAQQRDQKYQQLYEQAQRGGHQQQQSQQGQHQQRMSALLDRTVISVEEIQQ
jgi:hypothetical protein